MKKITSVILVAGFLFLAGMNLYFLFMQKQKVGYINIQQVFKDFTYKKQLESELKMVQDRRKNVMDSMEMGLKILARELQADQKNKEKLAEFETRREDYLNRKERFEEDQGQIVKQYDARIIKQMNQYIKDFGEKNKYAFIYGTDGTGSLMYADPVYDITKEVTEYINNSFKGEHP